MKHEENGWVQSAPLLCTIHSSFSGLFVMAANTENRTTAVMYLWSQASLDLTIFPLRFLPAQKNKTKYFPLCWSAWKSFDFCSSHGIFQNSFPPDNGPENYWPLAALQQSTCAAKFKHAFKSFAGSGVELAAFCCTKGNKVPSPVQEHWKFRFRTFTQEQSEELDFIQMTIQDTNIQRADLCLRSSPRCFPR